jgi:hypothetical protein
MKNNVVTTVNATLLLSTGPVVVTGELLGAFTIAIGFQFSRIAGCSIGEHHTIGDLSG